MRKVTEETIDTAKVLSEAGLNASVIADILDIGESTFGKMKTVDFNYEDYINYGRDSQTTTDTDPATEEKLDAILENQEKMFKLIADSMVVKKKQKRTTTDYNRFVSQEFKKNPNTTMSAVSAKWKKQGRKLGWLS